MQFKNQDPNFKNHTFKDFLKWQLSKIRIFNDKKIHKKWPKEEMTTDHFAMPKNLVKDKVHITYVGHVTFLIQFDGINILTDPIWSDRASPLKFLGPKRIQKPGIKFENLPKIDVVLISHNHYDHLDIDTLFMLEKKYKPLFIVPLENNKIIKKHIKNANIITLNWGEYYNFQNYNNAYELKNTNSIKYSSDIENNADISDILSENIRNNINKLQNIHTNNSIKIYLEPAQHWSARGLFDKNEALWGTFIIKTQFGDICFIGDSGYNKDMFCNIAKKHSNILVSLIPIGAYKPRWFMKSVHMDPLEAIYAHLDLRSKYSIASHFDVFPLADDSYGEAATEFLQHRSNLNIKEDNFILPKVGGKYVFI